MPAINELPRLLTVLSRDYKFRGFHGSPTGSIIYYNDSQSSGKYYYWILLSYYYKGYTQEQSDGRDG